jgi:hypothetical protein
MSTHLKRVLHDAESGDAIYLVAGRLLLFHVKELYLEFETPFWKYTCSGLLLPPLLKNIFSTCFMPHNPSSSPPLNISSREMSNMNPYGIVINKLHHGMDLRRLRGLLTCNPPEKLSRSYFNNSKFSTNTCVKPASQKGFLLPSNA